MAVGFSNHGANGQDLGFGSSTYTVSSVTVGTGYLLWFISPDPTASDFTSVTLLGQTATKLLEAANNRGEVWGASVTAGTGNLVGNASNVLAVVASNWVLLTGSTNTVSDSSSHDTSGGDPQIINDVTIPTDGGGVFFVGQNGTDDGLPSTWANVTRVAAMETSVTTGNTGAVSGATSTTPGTPSAEATGGVGSGWGFNADGAIIGLAFGPSGGGGGGYTLWPQSIF